MTEGEKRNIERRVMWLSLGVVGLLAVYLVVLVLTKKVNTILFPIGAAVILILYWAVSDILPIVLTKGFEDKTDEQKRSYCMYALIDAVGLGGLVYFIVNMTSTLGAIVYVASVFLKKKFRDEYLGIHAEDGEADDTAEAGEAGAEIPADDTGAEIPAQGVKAGTSSEDVEAGTSAQDVETETSAENAGQRN